jgi:signal transduction histidine kinase
MEIIDSRTVLIVFGLTSLFILAVLLAYVIVNRRGNWCLNYLVLGKTFQTLGLLGLGLHHLLPPFLTGAFSPCLAFLGFALEIFALTSWDLIYRRTRMILLLSLTAVFSLAMIIAFPYPDYIGGIVFASAGIIYFAFGGISLLSNLNVSRFGKLVGIIYLLLSFAFVTNLIRLASFGKDYEFLSEPSSVNMGVLIFGFLVTLLSSFGLILMQKDFDERTIKEDNIALKILNAKKDKFFSIIAHDLKDPMATLTELGRLLLERDEQMDMERRKEMLSQLHNNAKEAYNLLENLLQWARSESGKISFEPAPLPLSEVVNQTVSLLQEMARQKGHSVHVDVDDAHVVFADYNMVLTVLRNLLVNAIKFTGNGGQIYISSRPVNTSQIELSIKDTGIGIQPELLDSLFELSVDKGTSLGTNDEKGSGMGLNLCSIFIQKNNGEISVRSEPGVGSTFSFTLPVFDLDLTDQKTI